MLAIRENSARNSVPKRLQAYRTFVQLRPRHFPIILLATIIYQWHRQFLHRPMNLMIQFLRVHGGHPGRRSRRHAVSIVTVGLGGAYEALSVALETDVNAQAEEGE